MRLNLYSVLAFAALLLTGSVFAAGGGSVGGGTFPQAQQKSPRELAIDNYRRGIAERDKAWNYESEASDLAATDPVSNTRSITKLQKKAEKAFKSAAKRFKRAVRYESRFYQAHSSLGYALRRLGDYEGALASYDKALELNPDYVEAVEYRAEAYLALGRYEETKKAYVNLMSTDRERANQLMDAIKSYLENPPESVSDSAISNLKSWADERIALGELSFNSDEHEKTDWNASATN